LQMPCPAQKPSSPRRSCRRRRLLRWAVWRMPSLRRRKKSFPDDWRMPVSARQASGWNCASPYAGPRRAWRHPPCRSSRRAPSPMPGSRRWRDCWQHSFSLSRKAYAGGRLCH
jgi:hypothetical protein